jgi:hypothetical protein
MEEGLFVRLALVGAAFALGMGMAFAYCRLGQYIWTAAGLGVSLVALRLWAAKGRPLAALDAYRGERLVYAALAMLALGGYAGFFVAGSSLYFVCLGLYLLAQGAWCLSWEPSGPWPVLVRWLALPLVGTGGFMIVAFLVARLSRALPL